MFHTSWRNGRATGVHLRGYPGIVRTFHAHFSLETHIMSLDPLDLRLLALLQDDASLSNAELGERIGLSASQCSRRRAGLEAAGYIRGYRADLDARKLGYGIEAFTRVTLSKHSDATAEDFAHFLEGLGEVLAAHSVAGDTDYLLHVRVRSLDELGEFVLKRLLPHPHVHQVRSEVVLKTIKEHRGFRIGTGIAKAAETRKGVARGSAG
jgi:DNA-binding Lrp family transcriptional regulator